MSRFRLQHKLVREELGDPKQQGSLFGLALQLGWLNQVGLAAESEIQEKVYAFYHPTFQEYFAALAIADWDFFLPRAHDNHNPKPVSERYRIFEPQWKEVILLWLGREEVEREQFIEALGTFDDGCGDLCWYKYRMLFLAAAGIAEFSDCPWTDEIVERIVQLGFGHFNTEQQKWQTFLDPLAQGARVTLLQTDCGRAINKIINVLKTAQHENPRGSAPECLARIGTGNQQAIEALVRILETTESQDTRRSAAYSLGKILQKSQMPSVVSALLHCLADEVYESNFDLFEQCYEVIWHCAQNMTYPAFYQAWHPQEEVEKTTTLDSQTLNQADLRQSLQIAIANHPQLSQIIHLICIDGSQFIEPDRPAAEIYDQMIDQNCPECDSVPETMPALKLYWNSLKRKSDKLVVLVFYASSTDTTSAKGTALPCPYSDTLLTDLSKFGDRICVVTNQPINHIPLQFFAPSQPITDVVEWIRKID
ncbi:MAG: HEAT repeat domain-containing protein [Cyanobacteriota bacterium]